MGQKVNPTIFRLGVNQKWDTEFFEKKRNELPLYVFKDLEIKNYIERFLKTQGLILHDYKHFCNDSTLNFYISYFVSSEFIFHKLETTNILLANKSGKTKKISLETNKKTKINKILKKEKTLLHVDDYQKCHKMLKYLKSNNYVKNFVEQKASAQQFGQLGSKTDILREIFRVLSLFTKNQTNIQINFCCLNKDLSFLKLVQKKNFRLLRRFRNTTFMKEGIELLFYFVHSNNSARLLAKFIASQVRRDKRHKFFLSSLKKSLIILLKSSFSKIKGIKIAFKGRLNGVPRAKHKILIIGEVPVQSISEKINYYQTTTTSPNGSYGIKVWVIEK